MSDAPSAGSRGGDGLDDAVAGHTSLVRADEDSLGARANWRQTSTFYVRRTDTMMSLQAKEIRHSPNALGRIASSQLFEQVTVGVIVLNAIEIGWDADYSARWHVPGSVWDGPLGFVITTIFFSVYFTLEIVIRFLSYRVKWRCLCDPWFVFDAGLVALMLVENFVLPFLAGRNGLGQLSVLRLLRLLRIARMVKLMRAFPQLMMIIRGISAALKAVVWSGVLMLLFTLTAAIVFTSIYHQGLQSDEDVVASGDTIRDFFGSTSKSMLSLLVMGTILDDVTACSNSIREKNDLWMLTLFLCYILLNSFTLLNMLTGILVDVVGNTAEGENDRLVQAGVMESVHRIFVQMDQDGSGVITQSELMAMKEDESVMNALRKLGIKEKHFDMYVELLFETHTQGGNEPTFDFEALMETILCLRPGARINALDFAAFKRCLLSDLDQLHSRTASVAGLCRQLLERRHLADGRQTPASTTGSGSVPALESETDPAQVWSALVAAEEAPAPRPISAQMLSELERTASHDIIRELQRRLKVADLEETGVPFSMMDEELQRWVQSREALRSLGAPTEPSPDDWLPKSA